MAQAIKVDSPFVTAQQTADTLGVPRSRAHSLIEKARRITRKVVHREAPLVGVTDVRRERKGTSGRPHAQAKISKTKSTKATR